MTNAPDSSASDSAVPIEDIAALPFVTWSRIVNFLVLTLEMEQAWYSVDYAASGMFDLTHATTLEQLELSSSLQVIQCKMQVARWLLQWLAENRHLADQ